MSTNKKENIGDGIDKDDLNIGEDGNVVRPLTIEPKSSEKKRMRTQQLAGSDARKLKAGKADHLLAKLAFLNGETNRQELMSIGSCSERTLIQVWLPQWEMEKKRMYLSFREASLQLAVTDDELQAHVEHIQRMRGICDNYAQEIEQWGSMKDSLETIVQRLKSHPAIEDLDLGAVESLLNTYVTSKKAYTNLTTQYVKMTTEWSKQCGLEAHHSASAARIKEAERLRGKDDAGRDSLAKSGTKDVISKATKTAQDVFFDS